LVTPTKGLFLYKRFLMSIPPKTYPALYLLLSGKEISYVVSEITTCRVRWCLMVFQRWLFVC